MPNALPGSAHTAEADELVQVLRSKIGAVLLNCDVLVDLTDGHARERAEALRRSADAAAWAIQALDRVLQPAA